jgi:hypothetical protein
VTGISESSGFVKAHATRRADREPA